ncbi:MAG: hypothetical protein IJX56_01660, partial [Alistipes sp.]|nr:hypothetical protein [Alistipes sp.]
MLRFRLFSEVPGDFSIRKIRLESLSGKLLNGEATVDIEAAEPVLTVTSGTSALTVNVEETVLTDVETVVYAVLPATAFAANDLKVTFTAYNNLDAAEGTFEVTLPSALTLERGQITTLKYTFRAEEFKGTTEKWEEAGEVATAAELQQALNEGIEEIELQADVTLTEPLTIPATSSTTLATRAAGAGFTLDLNGYTISGTDTTTKSFGLINMQAGSVLNIVNTGATVGRLVLEATNNNGWNRYSAVVSNQRGVLTVGENIEIEHLGGTDMSYGIDNLTNGKGTQAITIINGATVKSTYRAIRQFLNGTEAANELYINSGVIEGANKSVWMQDPNTNANPGKLVVSKNVQLKGNVYLSATAGSTEWPLEVSIAEEALVDGSEVLWGTVPAGYHVAKLDGVWQVIEVEEGTVTSEESLSEALEQISAENDTVTLAPGEYVIPDTAKGETFAIVGTHNPEDTVIASQNDGGAEGECDYSLEGSTVTFENVTITTTSTYFPGYARMKGIYKNCIINGVYTLYDDSEFVDCTFNISGDFYNVWTWGALHATFTRCTFNCDGKAVLLYGGANTTLTMNECTFNDKGGLPDLKAAIEIGNDYGMSYNLIVNEATVNGFEINDKGINTGTTLWANKNSMTPEKLNVVVDGVDVY